jgi:hypothetical protein
VVIIFVPFNGPHFIGHWIENGLLISSLPSQQSQTPINKFKNEDFRTKRNFYRRSLGKLESFLLDHLYT